MLVVGAIDELRDRLGQELGMSAWHHVTQDDINTFADVTGDRQWIHVDVEASRSGPFHGTIAHGFYTLSLIPMLMGQVISLERFGFVVNYGLNKVRFPAPLPVGERVRLRLSLEAISSRPGSTDITFLSSFECASQEKPVCVAESVVRVFELRS
ncbi:MAG TPA: MaoC family dehydratase [Candidatus Dormibacteraeota bacterium]|nr:MaoC family dehydratase [Candidatus Dormibacteraeota bacterium]